MSSIAQSLVVKVLREENRVNAAVVCGEKDLERQLVGQQSTPQCKRVSSNPAEKESKRKSVHSFVSEVGVALVCQSHHPDDYTQLGESLGDEFESFFAHVEKVCGFRNVSLMGVAKTVAVL